MVRGVRDGSVRVCAWNQYGWRGDPHLLDGSGRQSDAVTGDASALAATVYLGSFVVAAFAYSNPIVLAGAGAGTVVAGVGAKATRALRSRASLGSGGS